MTCIISDEQIGFRSDYRTSDHIFKSKTILDKYLNKSKMVYAYFIDLRNELDSVLPPTLSFKVVDAGVGGHFLSVLKSMYDNIELRVRLDNISLSDVISSSVGVFHGDNLSPNLFRILINAMTKLFYSSCCPVSLGSRLLNSLLYADDFLLLSESAEGLQNCMNNVDNYCLNWGLEINYDKSKVMIFNKSGRVISRKFI